MATKPHCSCGGELVITGDIRSPDGWRTGFKLQCKKCGANWTYSGGIYHADKSQAATSASSVNIQ